MTRRTIAIAALASLASLSQGCGGEEEGEFDELCEHLEAGPAEAVEAASDIDLAPAVADDHTRYDITLTDGSGFVSFNADEAGEFLFGGDVDAFDLGITDSSGATIEIEETVAGPCTFASKAYVADLAIGSYTLEIGASAGALGLVIEHGGEHDEDEHDH